MKHLALTLAIFGALLATLLFSCKKDDADPVEESPFFSFFDEPSIVIDTTPVALSAWEYGFVFNPLKDGAIRQLGMKLPTTGPFSVRLWDLNGGTPVLLHTETLDATSSHVPVFRDINSILVQKDDVLGITVRANSFYRIEKQDGSAFALPKTVGNIRIVSFNEAMSDNPGVTTFPDSTNNKRVAPCVNVVFVAE